MTVHQIRTATRRTAETWEDLPTFPEPMTQDRGICADLLDGKC